MTFCWYIDFLLDCNGSTRSRYSLVGTHHISFQKCLILKKRKNKFDEQTSALRDLVWLPVRKKIILSCHINNNHYAFGCRIFDYAVITSSCVIVTVCIIQQHWDQSNNYEGNHSLKRVFKKTNLHKASCTHHVSVSETSPAGKKKE